jgi:hypothetical protein
MYIKWYSWRESFLPVHGGRVERGKELIGLRHIEGDMSETGILAVQDEESALLRQEEMQTLDLPKKMELDHLWRFHSQAFLKRQEDCLSCLLVRFLTA